ncbi:hypothetical protein LDO26_00985 [Luteimonas sp. BDR2-5]|uniref:hypothetical protein n=1 Tax=Proluteimonas luteida TaxID=2878685 RepID=UPI001E5A26A0|nr:hypothetical protein [Luteimonas sp. BDR2-5]MCD9026790.1 hypothetical protein [Luteimonas sp. BDR2-5]
MSVCRAGYDDFRIKAHGKLDEYLSHGNKVFGGVSFATALACLGLENPAAFAVPSLVFVALLWGGGPRDSWPYLNFLRRTGDPAMKPLSMLRRNHVAVAGWLFLGMVALGVVPR